MSMLLSWTVATRTMKLCRTMANAGKHIAAALGRSVPMSLVTTSLIKKYSVRLIQCRAKCCMTWGSSLTPTRPYVWHTSSYWHCLCYKWPVRYSFYTRLRSNITQDHLEAFTLMMTEKSVLSKLSNEKMIDTVAASCKELLRLLAL